MSVEEGGFVALIGPNGAGKTSLFNLISGLTKPTAGTIRLAGRDIGRHAPHRRARLGMGRTFQTSSVFGDLTVGANVGLAVQARTGESRRFWRLATPDGGADAARALDLVRLSHRVDYLAGDLSHGDKRKLELALLLARGPRFILLDEPMAGVSAGEIGELTNVIHTGSASELLDDADRVRSLLGVARTAWGNEVRAKLPDGADLPRVAVWHGTSDTTVAPANGDASVAQWLNADGGAHGPAFG